MNIVEHVKQSFELAERNQSKLPQEILEYQGFTGTKTRHFYNNICSLPGASYLEIGTWYGSSSLSAVYGNSIDATFIDNWSQFGGNPEILKTALNKYTNNYKLIESDCWKVDRSTLSKYDIYLYDGAHTYADQYRAISYYHKQFKPNCIIMVDDWNWPDVRKGTLDALSDLNIPVIYSRELFVPQEDTQGMPNHAGKHTWWNGIGVFVLGLQIE
jgi:hypothetical protein